MDGAEIITRGGGRTGGCCWRQFCRRPSSIGDHASAHCAAVDQQSWDSRAESRVVQGCPRLSDGGGDLESEE